MRYRANHLCLSLLAVVALTAVVGGCNDSVAPTADIVLATLQIAETSVWPNPPATPVSVSIQFGVYSDPPDPSSDYPIPFPFGDKMLTEAGQTVTYPMGLGADPRTVAARLTDGDDESMAYWLLIDGNPSTGGGSSESDGLTFTVSHSGPDLKGYVVTSFTNTLNALSLTQEGDGWHFHADITGKFYGHKL